MEWPSSISHGGARAGISGSIGRCCRHIKVKRLFFFFATRYDYGWLKHLNRKAYDLGSGKRVVTKGGRLDSEYLITVPEAFHGPE